MKRQRSLKKNDIAKPILGQYDVRMKEPGLDKRHRDKTGQIDKKRSDTQVKTLRKIYGPDFLPGVRGDKTLGAIRKEMGGKSLSKLVKKGRG